MQPRLTTKRKYTTSACRACRTRRVKCDGGKPACQRCNERALECIYSEEEDGRRPAPRSYVELLRARISLLEQALKDNSIDVEKSLADAFNSSTSTGNQPFDPGSAKTTTLSGSLASNAPLNFDADGEARYFGLTSGRLEFTGNLRDDRPKPLKDEQLHNNRFPSNQYYEDVASEQLVSRDLEDHLIDSYFKWEQPWAQTVDEKLFRESRASNGKYSNPLLLNCILAAGSRVSPREDTRSDLTDPNSAGRLFLEKAEILLHFELKQPTITTLQSLCILGVVSVAVGHDAAGWLHAGMANRLALDMGLNFNSSSVMTSAWLSKEEIESRKRIYWTLYCIDKWASMYTGRVCTMLENQAEVDLPDIQTATGDIRDADPLETRRCVLGKIQRASIRLAHISEKILLALYYPKVTVAAQQRASFLASTLLDLKNWSYDLPKELGLEYNRMPQQEAAVYIVHMLYHNVHILLMKPSLLRVGDQESRKRSYQAASEICDVASKYRKKFGSFRLSPITATHCTLSAILTFLNAADHKWEGVNMTSNAKCIDLCLTVLEELSISWNPAKRIHQNVQKLLKHHTRQNKPNKVGLPPQPNNPDENSTSHNMVKNHVESPSTTLVGTSSMVNLDGNRLNTSIVTQELTYQVPDSTNGLGSALPLDEFSGWASDFASDNLDVTNYNFEGALHNFSYMESNPVFQLDFLPDDYSSIDVLNKIHVHNAQYRG